MGSSPQSQLLETGRRVEFLGFIQSLLEHGGFVSTYKFALLQALADISLESDPEPDGTLRVALALIAEKFIAYYWTKAAPFHLANGEQATLHQNSGPKNAAIVGRLAEIFDAVFGSFIWERVADLDFDREQPGETDAVVQIADDGQEAVGDAVPESAGRWVCGATEGRTGLFPAIVVRLCRREWLDMVGRLNKGLSMVL